MHKRILCYENLKKHKAYFEKHAKGFFNISSFSVGIQTPCHRLIYLTSNRLLTENYVSHNYQLYDPKFSLKMLENHTIFSWNDGYAESNFYKNTIIDLSEKHFGLYHGTMLTKEYNGYRLILGFGAPFKDVTQKLLFYNNRNKILNLGIFFYEHFRNDLIEGLEYNLLPKPYLFKEACNIVSDSQSLREKLHYLGTLDYSLMNNIEKYHLTPRELDCLCLISLGFSAKEIADQLGISFRTIEKHINQLKVKFSCQKVSVLCYEFGKIVGESVCLKA